jgi:hypothetical protein
VVVFPEGTRTRPGGLGQPRRGIGRLALETGAPVAPVAVLGSDAVRRGWRIRPRKVRLRVGAPLRYPVVENYSPALAGAVTERIWACISLQWEWLGGEAAASEQPGGRRPQGAGREEGSPGPERGAPGREVSRAA